MPRREESTSDFEPNSDDTIGNFLADDSPWPEKPSQVLIKFKEKIHWVFSAGHERGLCDGEIVQMINITFGYYRRDTPWGKMDEIREWLINNSFRKFQMLSPKYHNELMRPETEIPNAKFYAEDFRKHESMIQRQPRSEW
jgi:hypothetical protein